MLNKYPFDKAQRNIPFASDQCDWSKRTYTKLLLLLLVTAITLSACHKASECRSSEEVARFDQTDRAIENNDPMAKALIDRNVAGATDSLTYYEYYAQYIKYYCLSTTPDSMSFFTREVLDYAEKQPRTLRINNLLAYVYSLRASHKFNFLKVNQQVIDDYTRAYECVMQSDGIEKGPLMCANLADAYIFINELPKGIHWYRRALFLVDSLHLSPGEYMSINAGLASAYIRFQDYKQAKHYLNTVSVYYNDLTPGMKAYYLTTLGNYYYYKKDYANGLKTYKRLQRNLRKEGKEGSFDMYYCMLNLADIYFNLGKTDEARALLDRVEPFLLANNDSIGYYYSQTIRLGIATSTSDTDRIDTLIRNTNRTKNVIFSIRQVRNRYLRKYYVQQNDYKTAYLNLKRDIQLNDSLEHRRMDLQTSEIIERFMQDTLHLHHNLIIQQQKASLQETQTWVLAVGCLAAILALILTFWIMRSHKRQLQDQMSIMQLKLFSARNRISPHFTFNVLNNSIMNANSKEAQDLLEMSRLIRANLDLSVKPTVTLREELEFVKQYVRVESRIVGSDFTFRLDIDPRINPDGVKIPSMFLQIITENAFVHGLKGWDGHKELTIRAVPKNCGICISVSDNGPGFDIRSTGPRKRTGLNIITQTIAIINEHNKQKMRFEMHNIQNDDSQHHGCTASFYLPTDFHFME